MVRVTKPERKKFKQSKKSHSKKKNKRNWVLRQLAGEKKRDVNLKAVKWVTIFFIKLSIFCVLNKNVNINNNYQLLSPVNGPGTTRLYISKGRLWSQAAWVQISAQPLASMWLFPNHLNGLLVSSSPLNVDSNSARFINDFMQNAYRSTRNIVKSSISIANLLQSQ